MAAHGFIDAHYHIWDVTHPADSGHAAEVLGGPAELHPHYTSEMYLEDMKQTGRTLKAAVFVEALPSDGEKEVAWVRRSQLHGFPQAIVARADLTASNIEDTLAQLTAISDGAPVRGIRQILNWEPTWPFVAHGTVISSPEFEKGFALLGKHGLSFDLHINPYQMPAAAALLSKYPDVPVVVDHLGCVKFGTARPDQEVFEEWRAGIRALAAAGPHVHVKISMPVYADKDWDGPNSMVPVVVHELLDLFGPQRCMVATNYPVDKHMGVDPQRLLAGLDALLHHLDDEDKAHVYWRTAARFYRIALP